MASQSSDARACRIQEPSAAARSLVASRLRSGTTVRYNSHISSFVPHPQRTRSGGVLGLAGFSAELSKRTHASMR